MTITKTVNWKTSAGKEVEVKIERTLKVQDKIVNLDGDKVNLGKETVDITYIELTVDGKFITRAYTAPRQLDPVKDKNLVAKGVHARLGDAYIAEELYNLIIIALEEIEIEITTNTEFAEVKAEEEKEEARLEETYRKEEENYNKAIKNGLCPKCGTYCYGDCGAK